MDFNSKNIKIVKDHGIQLHHGIRWLVGHPRAFLQKCLGVEGMSNSVFLLRSMVLCKIYRALWKTIDRRIFNTSSSLVAGNGGGRGSRERLGLVLGYREAEG